jgi:hypothetical protein
MPFKRQEKANLEGRAESANIGREKMKDENKDVWFLDPNMPQDEVDEIDEALNEAAQIDSRWDRLIWERDKRKIH